MSETIRDNNGKMIATVTEQGNKVITRDWTTNKIVATYDKKADRTVSWDNKSMKGNQSMRFVK